MNKKMMIGIIALLAVMVIGLVIYIVVRPASQSPSNSVESSSMEDKDTQISEEVSKDEKTILAEFDAKTWASFRNLYTTHNNFLKNMEAYQNGSITKTDLSQKCTEAEEYFTNIASTFTYGTTSDENTYLSAFEAAANAETVVFQHFKKYIDSGSSSDLKNAMTKMEEAQNALFAIVENRIKLLEKTGLSADEAKQKAKADLKEIAPPTTPKSPASSKAAPQPANTTPPAPQQQEPQPEYDAPAPPAEPDPFEAVRAEREAIFNRRSYSYPELPTPEQDIDGIVRHDEYEEEE